MIKQIPSTLVIALVCLVFAAWPSVQAWSEAAQWHHYLAHGLYLLAGGLFGMQTSWWIHQSASVNHADEAGVSS